MLQPQDAGKGRTTHVAVLLAAALGATHALQSRAFAQVLFNREFGGTTFTGPTSAHVSSMYFNPAALVLLTGTTVYVGGTVRLDDTSIQRAPIDSATGEPGLGANQTFVPLKTRATTPSGFAGIVWDLQRSNFRVGLAAYTPVAERQAPGQAILGYHSLGSSLYLYNVSASIAVSVSSKVAFGAGITFAFPYTDMTFLRDRGLEACPMASCNVEDPRYAERYHIHNNDFFNLRGLSLHLGFLMEIPNVPHLVVGIGLISPPAFLDTSTLAEPTDVEVSGFTGNGQDAYVLRGTGRIVYVLPSTITTGVRYSLGAATDVALDFRWQNLSRHSQYDVRLLGSRLRAGGVPEQIVRYRHLADTFALGLAVEHDATSRLRLAARLGADTSAVRTEDVSPSQVDAPKGSLSLGTRLTLSETFKVTAGYTLGRLLTRNVTDSSYSPSAYRDCVVSGYDYDVCQAAREGRAIPTAAGEYARTSHSFSLGLTLSWW